MMDIQASLLTYLWNKLTSDEELKSLMNGEVRLYLTWAAPDSPLPYLVYRIDMSNVADWSPVRRCTLYLDIWSYSPSVNEALNIRKRVMELLDNLSDSTGETTEFYLWIQTDSFIPESTEGMHHYAMQFNLKYLRDAQIGVLLKR